MQQVVVLNQSGRFKRTMPENEAKSLAWNAFCWQSQADVERLKRRQGRLRFSCQVVMHNVPNPESGVYFLRRNQGQRQQHNQYPNPVLERNATWEDIFHKYFKDKYPIKCQAEPHHISTKSIERITSRCETVAHPARSPLHDSSGSGFQASRSVRA